MKLSVDRPKLVELLAQGGSLASIGRELGYSDTYKIQIMLRLRGIRRHWTTCGVPVVEVRR